MYCFMVSAMSLEKQPVYSRLHEFKVNRKQVFSLLFVTALLLSSLVVLVKTPTAQASSIFEDGFETGDFTVVVVEEPETTPDTTVPTYNSITYSTSLAGNSSTFSGLFNDNVALQSGFISYNFNGMWTNDTSQTFSSTPYSYTKALTLPSANDTTVYWRFYVVDTSGNWLVTPIFLFTTTVNLEEESPLPTPTVTPTSPPTATPTTTPEPTPTPIVIFDTTTFYFRSDNYQYNTSLMGYGLDLTNTNLQLTISDTATSSISYGFRVWLLRSSGRIVELTSGAPVAIVSRTSEGSGYQSATWTVPSTLTVLGMDRLLITISAEVDDSGSWITRATYLSNKLMTKQILSATWNFTLYTSLADSTGSFRFGSGTYESKIEGVGFKVPVEQEVALFYAGQGDFVGAVLHPFIFWIGNLFYGLALLFAAGTVYLRYKKFEPVLILVILFGGGGSLGFLIPDVAYRLYYFLLLFVIAVVFWRVFK